jgi:dienelactone hydrolase
MMVPVDDVHAPPEPELLAWASRGDSAAFERLMAGYRRELYAHCYRMLASVQDTEDTLQGWCLSGRMATNGPGRGPGHLDATVVVYRGPPLETGEGR